MYKSLLFGAAVGDALGVPVEFKSREYLRKNPVTGMQSGGTHGQVAGTWSDDTSLALCLTEALTEDEFSLKSLANRFVRWRREGYWTPHGQVFDIGNTTDEAILRIESGRRPDLCGGDSEQSNGNGSLMRIAPLVFYLRDKNTSKRFDIIQKVSSLTHAHIRSVIACYYYLEFARRLITTRDVAEAYFQTSGAVTRETDNLPIAHSEMQLYSRLLQENIQWVPEEEIRSDGYVVHTLEASIWCLMNTDNYKDAVLKAVNLGYDTDTTAAVTGALAGLLYGYESIPEEWLSVLARREDIEALADRITKLQAC